MPQTQDSTLSEATLVPNGVEDLIDRDLIRIRRPQDIESLPLPLEFSALTGFFFRDITSQFFTLGGGSELCDRNMQ